jgi:hypothetical protein
MLEVLPPVKAEMTNMSPFLWRPENDPSGLSLTVFWKNQMPMLASPLGETRSAPNIRWKLLLGAV